MVYSPAYDVQKYVLLEQNGLSIEAAYGDQIKHPCNWLGSFPGINLLSSPYRLATSCIDIISAVYLRSSAAFLKDDEDFINKTQVSDLKIKNGTLNFGRSMVELSYIFIMAATLMIKLTRATRHMPIMISHQFLSNFAKQHRWLGLI